jgi:sortase A
LFLAVVFLVIGCYLIIENSYQLVRGYKSNKNTSVLATSKDNDINSIKNITKNPYSTSSLQGLALYDMKLFLNPIPDTKREVNQLAKLSKDLKNAQALYQTRPEIGEEFAQIYIPKLDAVLPIFEGTSEDELELGVGHYADSVLPGENDNSVLAGHRDTVFRRLGEVGVGDSLIVRVSGRELEYKVAKVRIVDKEDRTVIVPRPRATLTVSTCYPFSYIGAAPKRYVLIGYLVQ